MKTVQILGLAAVLGCGSAFAANVTFAGNGTFQDGSVLGGTLVIDTATGIVQSTGFDLTVTGGSGSVNYVFDTLTSGGYEQTLGVNDDLWVGIDGIDSTVPGPNIQLDLVIGSATNLVNYAGGALCYFGGQPSELPAGFGEIGGNCGAYFSNWNPNAGEALSDPFLIGFNPGLAPTVPEPAAFWLLAVPAVWLFRRQRQTAASR